MIMNDMEKYFEKYKGLTEELESCPSVTEQAFLGRLHEERARKRFRRHTLALTLIGMAAALMVVIICRGAKHGLIRRRCMWRIIGRAWRRCFRRCGRWKRRRSCAGRWACRQSSRACCIARRILPKDWKILKNWKLRKNIAAAALTKSEYCTANVAGLISSGRRPCMIIKFSML